MTGLTPDGQDRDRAMGSSSGWGHAPARIMELRRRLEPHGQLVVVQEHYTSRRCSKCAFSDEAYVTNNSELEAGNRGRCTVSGQEPKTGLYGVRWCTNCKTRWNREVNAARNIRQVFLAMVPQPHARPPAFKHASALDGG